MVWVIEGFDPHETIVTLVASDDHTRPPQPLLDSMIGSAKNVRSNVD
jgi:hypothetical protein